MKTLKFKSELVEKILSGEKTSTWRLFDDKDLQVGDKLDFVNSDTKKSFGTGIITGLEEKTLGTVEEADFDGHETYGSKEEMYEDFKGYYGDRITSKSPLKIVRFSFNKISP